MLATRKKLTIASVLSIGVLCAFFLLPRPGGDNQILPAQYTDNEFWHFVDDFSEAGGYFRSDNFVSNETTFQHVIPDLRRKTKPGGAYIGVGPDQNFSYIIALKPKVAFIIDIRRQNMLLHLMYKSVFELASNRPEFLSRLFSRSIGVELPRNPTLDDLFSAIGNAPQSSEVFESNYRDVIHQLTEEHQFPLSSDDLKTIRYVYQAFSTAGPDIRYSFPSVNGWRPFPTYAELIKQTDQKGENHSYLATEENFQTLRRMEMENRVVPLVGDFAGDKAIRSVGEYLSEHGTTVTAFYTSNVEFYLFQNDDWRKFFDNVSSLPADSNSVFIRAFFDNQGLRFPRSNAALQPVTLLDSISDLVKAVHQGRVRNYEELVQRSW